MNGMRRDASAFTLIEVMVYVALSVVMVGLVMAVVARTAVQVSSLSSKAQHMLATVLMQEIVIRDMRTAAAPGPTVGRSSSGSSGSIVHMHSGQDEITWMREGNRIVRLQKTEPTAAASKLGKRAVTVKSYLGSVDDPFDVTLMSVHPQSLRSAGCTIGATKDAPSAEVTFRNRVLDFEQRLP